MTFLSTSDPINAVVRVETARTLTSHRAAIVASWSETQLDKNLLDRYEIPGVDGGGLDSIKRQFIGPLIDLLVEYVRTGEARYRDVYLDERLRFAPFRASPETRAEFFSEVLPADERAVLDVLGVGSTNAKSLGALFAELHAPLLVPTKGPTVRVLALGDCLLNELRVFLAAACRPHGVAVDVRNLYFSAVVDRALDSSEVRAFLRRNPMDLIAMSFLTYAGIPAYRALIYEGGKLSVPELEEHVDGIVGLMRGFLSTLRDDTDAPFLLHGVCGLPLTRWRGRIPFLAPITSRRRRTLDMLNARIRELVEHTPNAIFIDEDAIASRRGVRACEQPVIPRSVVRNSFFHTTRFGEDVSTAYSEIVRAYSLLHKTKVLLVDFDETLWEGVMADGPVKHYVARQNLLVRLKESGIVLVAVSKNDPENIRWNEMQLKPSDFAILKISWKLKADAIREVAHELDLGLDSMIFIDDNPVERAMVTDSLPEVRPLDAHDERTWEGLTCMLQFPNTKQTLEARSRTEMYRQQAARRELLSQSFDYAKLMHGLNLEAAFRRAKKGDLDRVSELIQRTNQFNTTTIRYSKQELDAILADDRRRVYVCSLSDKFGKLGLVAVAIIDRCERDAAFDSFVMSCRAMGFQLERLMVRLVIDAETDAIRFVGRIRPTDRNTPARSLFADCKFLETGPNEWTLERGSVLTDRPAWFDVSDSD